MDPVLNQTTTTRTTQGLTPNVRDFSNWSDSELRKELKKNHGQKVPRSTKRPELLSRLQHFENQRTGSFPISQQIITPISTVPISQPIITQNQTVVPVQQISRDYKNFSDRELRRDLKRNHGEKVPRNTERAELIRRLDVHENRLLNTGLPNQTIRDFTSWTDRELRKELKKDYGEKVPRNTERGELIRRLNVREKSTYLVTPPINQGLTGVQTQQYQSGFPIQQNTLPLQQQVPQQYQSGFPIQQNTLPLQQQRCTQQCQQCSLLGSQQQCQQCSLLGSQQQYQQTTVPLHHHNVPLQQTTVPIHHHNVPHQTGTNHHY